MKYTITRKRELNDLQQDFNLYPTPMLMFSVGFIHSNVEEQVQASRMYAYIHHTSQCFLTQYNQMV